MCDRLRAYCEKSCGARNRPQLLTAEELTLRNPRRRLCALCAQAGFAAGPALRSIFKEHHSAHPRRGPTRRIIGIHKQLSTPRSLRLIRLTAPGEEATGAPANFER